MPQLNGNYEWENIPKTFRQIVAPLCDRIHWPMCCDLLIREQCKMHCAVICFKLVIELQFISEWISAASFHITCWSSAIISQGLEISHENQSFHLHCAREELPIRLLGDNVSSRNNKHSNKSNLIRHYTRSQNILASHLTCIHQ